VGADPHTPNYQIVRFLYINPTKTGTPIKAMMTPTGIQAVPSMIRDMASATSKAMAPIGIESAYVVRISHRYIDRMRLGTTSPTKLIGPHCETTSAAATEAATTTKYLTRDTSTPRDCASSESTARRR